MGAAERTITSNGGDIDNLRRALYWCGLTRLALSPEPEFMLLVPSRRAHQKIERGQAR